MDERVHGETAGRFLEALRGLSVDDPGVTRASYSPAEDAAHGLAADVARSLGARVRHDSAGNSYFSIGGEPDEDASGRAIIIGSHLDSVPHGGNFDGAAGVAVGLGVLSAFARAERPPSKRVTVMGIRAEESAWFNASYVGSRAALGKLAASELDSVRRADTGRSLADHLRDRRLDPAAVATGLPLLDPRQVIAFIEPHIEQGPVLHRAGVPLAVVSAIRGSYRHREAACRGRWDHSGATPREDRRDAVVATADLVLRLDQEWKASLASGSDIAVTVGQIATDPSMHAFSKIAGRVDFSIDVRSTEPRTLRAWEDIIRRNVADVEADHGVTFDLGPRSESRPAVLDERLTQRTRAIIESMGIRSMSMVSGAGHDCAVFADAGIPSAMVFMRSTGGSHNPDEHLTAEDTARAVQVVTRLVQSIAD